MPLTTRTVLAANHTINNITEPKGQRKPFKTEFVLEDLLYCTIFETIYTLFNIIKTHTHFQLLTKKLGITWEKHLRNNVNTPMCTIGLC